MTKVKTISQSDAVSNETDGYMARYQPYYVEVPTIVIVGDKVVSWSTNTLDRGVSIS
jgi:hypothetical protein